MAFGLCAAEEGRICLVSTYCAAYLAYCQSGDPANYEIGAAADLYQNRASSYAAAFSRFLFVLRLVPLAVP